MKLQRYYYTYILECADGTFYVGIAYDLVRRLKQHNGVLKGGAKYTSGRRPVFLRYYEQYTTKQSAAKREYALKQLTREQKATLGNASSLFNKG